MIKTQLEGMLESGLSRLGSELGQRVYFDEILAAASVDDVVHDFSEVKYQIPEQDSPEFSKESSTSIVYELSRVGASSNQIDRSLGTIPLFRRRAQVGKFMIEYEVLNSVGDRSYLNKELCDAVITKRLYDAEAINLWLSDFDVKIKDLNFSDIDAAYLLSIGVTPENIAYVELFNKDEFPLYQPHLRRIYHFNEMKTKPDSIVAELIKFLKIHK